LDLAEADHQLARELREMTISNRVSELNATEPGTRSTTNIHMMNRMAVPGMAAEEVNLVMVAEVMVVENQLTEKRSQRTRLWAWS
jgi:hypothetical protein